MGTNYYAVRNRASVQDPIHIGKASIGWMFLFQEHNDTWEDPPIIWNTYDQVKSWLQEYTVDKNEFVIMDEYDRIIPFDELFELIDEKQKLDKNNPDNFTYCRNVNGYRFSNKEFL